MLRDDAELDEATVISYCKERLAGFKVPKKIVFADSLPRNPSGKILKRNLRDLYDQAE